MSTLENAVALAATAHAGQVDKAGAPYILHPLRIMLKMTTNEERIVAVLHDAVEDCDVTIDRLREYGFSEDVISGVLSVTKIAGEKYEAFVLRACANPIGKKVKLADLEDNMDLNRISNPTQRDFDRIAKYGSAVEVIKRMQ